jgi:uncharacterized protein (DUF1778 family)
MVRTEMARVASERLEFRVRADVKERIEHAAELARLPVGDFIRTAALARAEEVIRSSVATVVPARFFETLLAALDEAPHAEPALARAADLARSVVTSR